MRRSSGGKDAASPHKPIGGVPWVLPDLDVPAGPWLDAVVPLYRGRDPAQGVRGVLVMSLGAMAGVRGKRAFQPLASTAPGRTSISLTLLCPQKENTCSP